MSVRAIAFAATCFVFAPTAHADRLFADGLEIPVPPSQFPLADGRYRIPSGPAADQLAWSLDELRSGETTAATEIQAHFAPSFNVANLQSFFPTLRTCGRTLSSPTSSA